jgi:hypothetical protein
MRDTKQFASRLVSFSLDTGKVLRNYLINLCAFRVRAALRHVEIEIFFEGPIRAKQIDFLFSEDNGGWTTPKPIKYLSASN